MTRYAELYRKERADKEQLQRKMQLRIEEILEESALLRSFIIENELQCQLAEWVVKRGRE